MTAIRETLRNLLANERGATAIEYGLIAALIVVAMMAALGTLGGSAGGLWSTLDTTLATYM